MKCFLSFAALLVVLCTAGCGTCEVPELAREHPAHPAAAASDLPPMTKILTSTDPVSMPEDLDGQPTKPSVSQQ